MTPRGSWPANRKLEVKSGMASAEEEYNNIRGSYEMVAAQGEPPGLCLVFNIITDKVKCLPTRTGSSKDVERIRSVFGDRFGYEVEVQTELTGDQMKKKLEKTAQDFNTKWRCFVCFVLSHGLGEDYIADSEAKEVNVCHLMDTVSGKNCPRMNGIPKLFFLQMCRGFDREEYERSLHAYDATDAEQIEALFKNQNVAQHRDRLVCFATTPGLMAPMDAEKGSLFIQTLTKVLEEKGDHKDITKVLQEVTRRVDGKSHDGYKVCPIYESTLAFDLTFPLRVKKETDDYPTLKGLPAGVPRTRLSLSMADVIGELSKAKITNNKKE